MGGIDIYKAMVGVAICNNKEVRSCGMVAAATYSSKARVAAERYKCRARGLLLQM